MTAQMSPIRQDIERIVSDSFMGDQQDTFTLADRKELIKQGLQLDSLQQDIMDVKLLFNEDLRRLDAENRIRRLEDFRLRLESSVRASYWWMGLIGTATASIVTYILRLILK